MVNWPVVRQFLIIFLPLSALVGSIAMVLYYKDVGSEVIKSETSEVHTVDHQVEMIVSDFKLVVSDLMFLSEYTGLQEMLEGGEADQRKALSEDYLSYSKRKGVYDQIRFIDETGMEVVRVNYNSGEPYIVPENQLQFKGERYYFKETSLLGHGEVYVSPFDLNIEGGKIEQPLKPMIRFGTPVFDSNGRKRGIVFLNYLGVKLIDRFKRVSDRTPGQSMLLNSDGFYLKGPRPEDEWGFMYEDRRERTFGNAFSEAWQQISTAGSGQFVAAEGMFTFATVYPLETKKYYWKVISHMPFGILNYRLRILLGNLLILYAITVVILAIGSWFLASVSVKRKLAEEKLKEAYQELKGTHQELKNTHVQLLQAGKMAAMGEIAAGVAHELTQPLMGIKGFASAMFEDVKSHSKPATAQSTAKDLEVILQQTERMTMIVNNIRDFARSSGKEKVLLNINEPIEAALMLFFEQLRTHNIVVEKDLAEGLPRVMGNTNQLQQVFINMIINARDAIDARGEARESCIVNRESNPETRNSKFETPYIGRLMISTSAIQNQQSKIQNPCVLIEVKDNGIGADVETVSKMFESFFTTKTAGKGTGLGLAIVARIIDEHKGKIRVESKPGQGCRFTIQLPIA